MARTKRKENPLQVMSVTEVPKQRIYHVGAYIRLSVEDNGKPNTDTIENQKELVKRYIEEQPDMEFFELYCDNGRTGTDFERPEFERLMQDVRKGTIDCIVVKDLSRFGRNYRETGNYLERIFPFLEVRFVAVADQLDTLHAKCGSNNYLISLKNIINEIYSKDISRKSGSALAVKQRKGEFIGTWAAYGYKKCADNPHQIEPDKETAPIVKKMFAWRLSGMGYRQITRNLNEQGIPSPSRYHYLKGDATCERYANAIWRQEMVKKILTSKVYLGHMVQGKKRASFYEGKPQQQLPESEWIIVRNTHEPLIDTNTFYAVQELADQTKTNYRKRLGKYDQLDKTPNVLKKLVYCADCNHPLVRYKSVTCKGTKATYFYICPTHAQNPESCPKKYLPEMELLAVLWESIKRQMELADNLRKQLRKLQHFLQTDNMELVWKREADAAIQAKKRAQILYDSLYPMYAEDKVLTEREYTQMKQTYQMWIGQTQKVWEQVEEKRKAHAIQAIEKSWLVSFTEATRESSLTEELAHQLISRVEIDKNHQISILFHYQDEYHNLLQLLETAEKEVLV